MTVTLIEIKDKQYDLLTLQLIPYAYMNRYYLIL